MDPPVKPADDEAGLASTPLQELRKRAGQHIEVDRPRDTINGGSVVVLPDRLD